MASNRPPRPLPDLPQPADDSDEASSEDEPRDAPHPPMSGRFARLKNIDGRVAQKSPYHVIPEDSIVDTVASPTGQPTRSLGVPAGPYDRSPSPSTSTSRQSTSARTGAISMAGLYRAAAAAGIGPTDTAGGASPAAASGRGSPSTGSHHSYSAGAAGNGGHYIPRPNSRGPPPPDPYAPHPSQIQYSAAPDVDVQYQPSFQAPYQPAERRRSLDYAGGVGAAGAAVAPSGVSLTVHAAPSSPMSFPPAPIGFGAAEAGADEFAERPRTRRVRFTAYRERKTDKLTLEDLKTMKQNPKLLKMYGISKEELEILEKHKKVAKQFGSIPLSVIDHRSRPKYDGGQLRSSLKESAQRLHRRRPSLARHNKRVERQKRFEDQCILECQQGAFLTKFGPKGKLTQRFFIISKDRARLYWGHSHKRWKRKKLHFGDLQDVVPGKGFERMTQSEAPPWLCFTLTFTQRDIHLACPDIETFQRWFMGVQALGPLTSMYMTRGMLLWYRAIWKLDAYQSDPRAVDLTSREWCYPLPEYYKPAQLGTG